ncbi:hypothetical protein ACTG9Q_08460 [Actinokineospora sp. 24-640]
MRPRSAAALVSTVLSALLLSACAPADPAAQAPRSAVADPGPAAVGDEPVLTAGTVLVTTPKRAPAVLDCGRYLPVLRRVTGIDVEVRAAESTGQLCRYALPYNRGTTTASVFFRAEPPGTPSYRPTAALFGNSTYQVGGNAGKDCGFSVAIDAAKRPHQHGSHLTVLGTYEAVEKPCTVAKAITEVLFDQLDDI